MQLKDRHNANIMIDRKGHLIHIDFDYFISNSPGNNLHFENAPFKLTTEYIEVMGGEKSECFAHFRQLMIKGMLAIQKEYKRIMVLIEMMLNVNRNLPCFVDRGRIISEIHSRVFPKRKGSDYDNQVMSEKEAEVFVDRYCLGCDGGRLISEAYGSLRTKFYDIYQYYSQGIN